MSTLKNIRIAKSLSQSQLSAKTRKKNRPAISVPAISAYENGRKRMREDTIRRFADALGVSSGEILGNGKRKRK